MNNDLKIHQQSTLVEQIRLDQQQQQKIVLCHGHFNLIHPGHLRFIQYAKSLGTRLIVAVYSENYLSKQTHYGRYYPQAERAVAVSMLQDVDYVIILDELNITELVQVVRPDFFVMGKEFEEERNTEVEEAIQVCREFEGKVVFHAGEVHYASVSFLHRNRQEIQSDRQKQLQQISQKYGITRKRIETILDSYQDRKMLVIGDTIVDQYVACDPLGMSSEAPVLVVKELEKKEFVGGAAIVASHLQALGASCHYVSVIGNDDSAKIVKENLISQDISHRLLTDDSRPTTFKIRYMVDHQKLFRVSRLQDHSLHHALETQLIEHLEHLIPQMDGVLVCDFVYGVITQRVLEAVTKIAQKHGVKLFGDLQCSSQVGNVAKFQNFDLICPTEKEARIALSNHESGLEWIANTLIEHTKAHNLLLTMGSEGFIAYENQNSDIIRQHYPALEVNPVDTAGAGDSLLAALALSICSGANLREASLIGACMAGISVQTVGNVPVPLTTLRNEFHFLN